MKQSYVKGKQAQDMELFTLRKFAFVPSVVPLLEDFTHNGYLHLVFELLDTNLIDYYKELRKEEGRNLSSYEIKSVLYQVCLALDAMHQEGYAHRDIKPENVLIRKIGPHLEAKLTDFGLTKKLDKLHNTNYVATRWYRSP
jgi:serine/threonine protein kinase